MSGQRSEFARLVRELRRAKGFSLRQLGGKADIDFTYLSKIENDEYVPSVTAIHKVAAALEASPTQVRRLIETSDKRRDRPAELAPAASRDAQILLRRIYSGAVTKEEFKEMLDVTERNGGGARADRRSARSAAASEQERLFRR